MVASPESLNGKSGFHLPQLRCGYLYLQEQGLLRHRSHILAPVPICGDNQGAIFIASNPVTEKRSKHIDIHFHYIREVIKKKLIELYFIDGENNPADMLTKNLGRVKFQKFRAMIGLEFLE